MKRTFDGKNLLAMIGWLSGLIPGLSPAKKYDVESRSIGKNEALMQMDICGYCVGSLRK